MWKVYYSDNSFEIFEDITFDSLPCYIDDKKIIIKIENLDYIDTKLESEE